MHVLAFRGPNWTSEATDVSENGETIAIATGRTVMLYERNGTCTAEIRATGRGRVSSLAFCKAKALTHLLAVLTTDAVIRLFDVYSRRIVRNVSDGRPATMDNFQGTPFAVRFVPNAPHIIFLLSTTGNWITFRIDTVQATIVSKGCLSIEKVTSVTTDAQRVFVSCKAAESSVVFSLSPPTSCRKPPSKDFFSVNPILCKTRTDDISISKDGTRFAIMSSGLPAPIIRPLSNEIQDEIGVDKNGDIEGQASGQAQEKVGIRACVAWVSASHVVSSNARGSLTLWYVDNNELMPRQIANRLQAHIRQVLCIRVVQHTEMDAYANERPHFVTTSADNTIALWMLQGDRKGDISFKLVWRTARVQGPIHQLVFKHETPAVRDEARENCNGVLTFATAGTLTSMRMKSHNPLANEGPSWMQLAEIIGEVSLPTTNMNALGKRNRDGRAGRKTNKANSAENAKNNTGTIHVNESAGIRLSLAEGDCNLLAVYRRDGDDMGVIRCTDDKIVTQPAYKQTHDISKCRVIQKSIWPVAGGFVTVRNREMIHQSIIESNHGNENERLTSFEQILAVLPDNADASAITAVTKVSCSSELMVMCTAQCIWLSKLGEVSRKLLDLQTRRIVPNNSHLTAAAVGGDTLAVGTSDGRLFISPPGINEGAIHRKSIEEGTWGTATLGRTAITQLKWSWDGEILACVVAGNDLSIWRRTVNEQVKTSVQMEEYGRIKEHLGGVNVVAWTSLRTLVTAGEDSTLRLWNVMRLPVVNNGKTLVPLK